MATKLVKSEESRGVRQIYGRVDVAGGTPSVGKGSGYTVVDTAAGQVQIVFNKAGRSILSAVACPIEGTDATGHFVKVDAKVEASSVTFGIYVADGVDGALADDVSFYFQVVLSDVD